MAILTNNDFVLPAVSFDQILGRAQMFGQPRPLRDRLVSVALANPTSPIWRDLAGNRGFLDARSGTEWDLFFAGLSGYAPDPRSRHPVPIDHPMHGNRDFPGYYNPELFNEVAEAVEEGHRRAMGPSDITWRYRGGTDLVSFMVYDREPDWASLKSVSLYTDDGTRLTLIHVVEGLTRWQREEVDPRLAPGEFSPAGLGRETGLLIAALGWSASAVVGGVLGDAAFELVKQVL